MSAEETLYEAGHRLYLVQRKSCGGVGVDAAMDITEPTTQPTPFILTSVWRLVSVVYAGNEFIYYWKCKI